MGNRIIVNRTFELQDGRIIDIPMDVMKELDKAYDHQFKCIERRAEIRRQILNAESIAVSAIALAVIAILAAGIVSYRFESLEKEVDILRRAKLSEKKIEQKMDVPGGSLIIKKGETNDTENKMEGKTEGPENRAE